jgi:hypothetical protein
LQGTGHNSDLQQQVKARFTSGRAADDSLSPNCSFVFVVFSRILDSPRGNALLVGVGGSGKQSLSRLAANISGLEVFQVQLRQGYGVNDLKADLALLYMKAGETRESGGFGAVSRSCQAMPTPRSTQVLRSMSDHPLQ